MRRRLAIAALVLGLLAPASWGQMRAMGPGVRSGFAPRGSGFVSGGFGFGHVPHFRPGFNQRVFFFHGQRNFFPRPFYWPAAYGGYYGGYSYGGYSNPIVIQMPPASYQSSDYEERRQMARAIDRLSDEVEQLREQRESQASALRPQPKPQPVADPGPPTVLVFRDKHIQETRNYAIVGQTLWVFNEQRATKIPLTNLDLPSTAKLNEERGVDFQLPR